MSRFAPELPLPAYPVDDGDPLSAAHAAVIAYLNEASRDTELKDVASGKAIRAASPETACEYVVAAILQARYWARAIIEGQNAANYHQHGMAHRDQISRNWQQAQLVVETLLRKQLPLQRDHVAVLLQPGAIDKSNNYHWRCLSETTLARALQQYAEKTPLDDELRERTAAFAKELAGRRESKLKTLAGDLDRLCARVAPESESAQPAAARGSSPQPAPLGDPLILTAIKDWLGLLPKDYHDETIVIGPDQFPMRAGSPLKAEHDELIAIIEAGAFNNMRYREPSATHAAVQLVERSPEAMGKMLLAVAEREYFARIAKVEYGEEDRYTAQSQAKGALPVAALQPFTLSREDACTFLAFAGLHTSYTRQVLAPAVACALRQVMLNAQKPPLTEGERYALSILRAATVAGPPLGQPTEDVQRLTQLIGDDGNFCLVPGEFWADQVNADCTAAAPDVRKKWFDLFGHTLAATGSKPTDKWLKAGEKLIAAIGADEVRGKLQSWLPLAAKGRKFLFMPGFSMDTRSSADTFHDGNATCLRGLVWLMQQLPNANELVRLLTTVALAAYKKVAGVGPRAVKVGNAAVYVLSQLNSIEAVGQLAMLKVRVKFGTAQKEIEKAFTAAAAALGLARDEVEEMGVPSYGLEEVGKRVETLGDYRAELLVTGSDASLTWFDAKGKELKSVPAAVKKDFAEDYKDLQQTLKDVQGMLPAQRDRLDSLFLAQKSWPIDTWRERYLLHPLVGTITQRLIWCVDGTPALFQEGTPRDVNGQEIEAGKTAEITLWHPAGRSVQEITTWRRRLEDLAITQPFKQAHREIYLLTAAEENTNTYSNRFAAHIIRQHQFNALCAARGWKNKLRLAVDDEYEPPSKELPQWGLRAEYWIEALGEDETNDSGVYLRLATDQVRFYRSGAAANTVHASGGGYESRATGPGTNNFNEPLPLSQVPALVFSEVMRDVDLFVGVASVGNDPAWQDSGPEGRYQSYWRDYSFGELSGSATTRKEVLERLIPRLKIASQCSFADRFLVVKGSLRTYKIHLGSGNILMEPNDQYLCIVPKQSAAAGDREQVFLPFEGDSTLSIILSKALLLANDKKITDSTITRQIKND